jgi:hypothetical protein
LMKLLVWEYLIRRKIRDHEGLQRKYAVELRYDFCTKTVNLRIWELFLLKSSIYFIVL